MNGAIKKRDGREETMEEGEADFTKESEWKESFDMRTKLLKHPLNVRYPFYIKKKKRA